MEFWTEAFYQDGNWDTNISGNQVTTTSITSFIRKSFSLSSLDKYYLYILTIKTNYGIIVYLNGKEIYRYVSRDPDHTLGITCPPQMWMSSRPAPFKARIGCTSQTPLNSIPSPQTSTSLPSRLMPPSPLLKSRLILT